jgi:cytochrome c-type biogenesis protein CcmH
MSDKQNNPNSGIRCPISQVGFARHSSLLTRHDYFWFVVLAATLFAASVAHADSARKPTLEAIGNEVQCTCGCNAPLNQCPMLNCAEKAEMRAFITKEIADGKDETTILQDVSIRFGVQALSSPPAKGFTLAVWILPGVGLLVGLGMVVVLVRRWRSKPDIVPVPSFASRDPKVLTAVEEEMKSTGMK